MNPVNYDLFFIVPEVCITFWQPPRMISDYGFSGHILQVQGKRNPSKMVGTKKGHQKVDRQKPQSQTTSQSDHMDHSLV